MGNCEAGRFATEKAVEKCRKEEGQEKRDLNRRNQESTIPILFTNQTKNIYQYK